MKTTVLSLTMFLMLLVPSTAFAQIGDLGIVTGGIYDSHDSLILGTKITISNDKLSEATYSDPRTGMFEFKMPPGVYSITTQQGSWFPIRRARFVVTVGNTTFINLYPDLKVVSRALSVTAEGAHDLYESNFVRNLVEPQPFSDSPLNVVIEYSKSSHNDTGTIYNYAQLTYNDLSVRADILIFDAGNRSIKVSGNVRVDKGGVRQNKDAATEQLFVVPAMEKPVTGYAPVNGLKMYYEVRGSGEPLVVLHGAFMAISGDWEEWVNELAKTRKVIAVEMQGHGRTADIKRDITYENLASDIAGLMDYLKIPKADVMGYSLGGGVAMQCAILHPEKVRKVVVISAPLRRDGWVKEANDFWPNFSLEMMKGSPAETEREKINPVPNSFPDFFNHIKAMAMRPYDFGADKLKATKAPFFFINGDADGVRIDHIAEMYQLKGGGNSHADMMPRTESRLAIIPNTTHVTLMNKMSVIVPMVNDFLDAKPSKL